MIRELPLSGRMFMTIILNRLRRLERDLVECIWTIDTQGTMTPFLYAQLHLAQKAVASAVGTLTLLRADLRQEAEGPQRSFIESWVFMMYFAWFPTGGALEEWMREPRAYFVSRKYKMKEQVEGELPLRLGLEAPAYMPLRETFRTFSNTSVHPTRDSAERAWSDAAWRIRFALPTWAEEKVKTPRFNAFAFLLVLFLGQLRLFLKFLRMEVLSKSEIPPSFRLSRPTILETLLNEFIARFVPLFKEIVDGARRELEESGSLTEED